MNLHTRPLQQQQQHVRVAYMKTCCISEGTHNKATALSMRLCKTLFLTWRGLVFFYIFFLELHSYCEGSWSVDKFPNPRLQPGKCGFTGTYCHSNDCLICDPDGLLTSDEGKVAYLIISIMISFYRLSVVNIYLCNLALISGIC